MTLGLVVSCRGHEPVCEGPACSVYDDPQLPNGGAAGEQNRGGAGEAGAPNGPAPCSSDQQCQNDSICDGEEVCTASGCEPGPRPECEHGTTCDDAAPEVCVYEEPSPWLVATSLGSLVALPTNQLGVAEPFTLAAKPGTGWLEGFQDVFWSPDGRVAILRVREEEFGHSFHYSRFGDGQPSSPAPVPDVPNFTPYGDVPDFSPDSRYVFINDSGSGTYLVDLKDSTALARHIPLADDGTVIATTFCADGRSWFASQESFVGDDRTWIGSLDEQGSITHTPIVSTSASYVSNDRRLVLLNRGTDDEGNWLDAVLRPCSSVEWSAPVPPAFDYVFSPDSKRLWLESLDFGQKVLSLDEPSAPVELLSSESVGATLTTNFSPDGSYLEASVDGVPHLVSLSQAASPPLLPLPGVATIAVLGSAALLAWSNDPESPDQLVWHAVPPSGPPVTLLEDITSNDAHFIADRLDPERIFVVRVLGETSELHSVSLDGSAPEAQRLLTIEGAIDSAMVTAGRAGVLFTRSSFGSDSALLFAPFEPDGELGKPSLVVGAPWAYTIQPWP